MAGVSSHHVHSPHQPRIQYRDRQGARLSPFHELPRVSPTRSPRRPPPPNHNSVPRPAGSAAYPSTNCPASALRAVLATHRHHNSVPRPAGSAALPISRTAPRQPYPQSSPPTAATTQYRDRQGARLSPFTNCPASALPAVLATHRQGQSQLSTATGRERGSPHFTNCPASALPAVLAAHRRNNSVPRPAGSAALPISRTAPRQPYPQSSPPTATTIDELICPVGSGNVAVSPIG
jgi:hypothetical protein